MSPAPENPDDRAATDRYRAAWADLIALVTEGHSWSGHERHVCYLNTGSGTFAGISFVSGLDYPEDGRALGLVDWDRDGDLDLWFRNRTAPRLRLLVNQSPANPAHAFVALKLESRTGNRDAVGAVVEVVPAPTANPSTHPARHVRSVRAGDLFLSQSSTWLHFGLGETESIEEVRVLWPGGTRERFTGITPGRRYLLREGSGQGAPLETPASLRPTKGSPPGLASPSPPPPAGSARIILPARIPLFASFSYRDPAGTQRSLGPSEKARLIVLWSETCPHCRAELRSLTRSAASLEASHIDVLALSVDGSHRLQGDNTAAAHALADQLAFPFPWGFLDPSSQAALQKLQATLFDRNPPASVPLSLLIDSENRLLALYRGAVEVETLLADVRDLLHAGPQGLHHLAPPLAGTWFTRPIDPSFVAENLARGFQTDFPEDAAAYLSLAAGQSTGPRRETLQRELAGRYHRLARSFREAEQVEPAAFYFEQALRLNPASAPLHHDYGLFLASYGQLNEAEKHLRRALQLDPGLTGSREALEMIARIRARPDG